jgi:hypothetical protein
MRSADVITIVIQVKHQDLDSTLVLQIKGPDATAVADPANNLLRDCWLGFIRTEDEPLAENFMRYINAHYAGRGWSAFAVTGQLVLESVSLSELAGRALDKLNTLFGDALAQQAKLN